MRTVSLNTPKIKALQQQVDALTRELHKAEKELHVAQCDAAGVAVGDVVFSKGEKYRVVAVELFMGSVWLKGNPQKKDGTWGISTRSLFDHWKKTSAAPAQT